MTKKKRIALVVLLCLGCFVLLAGLRSGLTPSVSKTIAALSDDLPALTAMATDILDAGIAQTYSYPGIQQISLQTYGDHPKVEFQHRAWGIGSESTYTGIYYSPDGCPLGASSDMPLTEHGTGWFWAEAGGDNQYYTENISGQWYAYILSF